jgi:hypothetical protein
MGAGNVKLVFAHWAHLDGQAFKVLTYMALTTKDADQPPRYWDRWETLAVAIGRLVPDEREGDENARLERQAALRAVNRATAELVTAGALSVIHRSSPGRNTVYELSLTGPGTLDADRRVNKPRRSMERSTVSGRNTRRSTAERSTVTGRTVDAQRPPPRKDEKEDKDVAKEEAADVRTAVTVPRVNTTAPEPDIAASDRTSPRCPHGNNPRRRRDGTHRCPTCREEAA